MEAGAQTLPRERGESEEREGRHVVEALLKAGYQLDPSALKLVKELCRQRPPEEVVEAIRGWLAANPQVSPILTAEALRRVEPAFRVAEEAPAGLTREGSEKSLYRPYAAQVEAQIKKVSDPSERVSSGGGVENFLTYFRDRFRRLQKLLRQRLDVKDAVSVSQALDERQGAKVKVFGMVLEKTERAGKVLMRLDDPEGAIRVLVSGKEEVLAKARAVLKDELICVVGVRGPSDYVYADDIVFPDIPQRRPNFSEEPVNVVFTSDFHFGSSAFQSGLVERLVRWLRGEVGNARLRSLASHVKYLVIGGDLVDGIGVYPEQENELAISDIHGQYKLAAGFLERIPDHIEVIIIPGNHDATRKAMPQPPISRRYAESVYNARKLHLLGNPCQVKLHNVNVLLHHGQSLEDLMATLPGANHSNPVKSMQHILKARHIAPVYGQKTPLAPEASDYLVIESPPDIYHTGHIHVFGHDYYRGTLLVNSGTWQGQTSYQRRLGVNPTVGVIPVVSLRHLTVSRLNFAEIVP